MLIFCRKTAQRNLWALEDGRNRRRVDGVVGRFASAFPSITYDVLWSSRTRNAQAFVSDGRRHVRLYGGLARHKGVSVAALVWVLAHETGHHLAGSPFDAHFPWISSEERANEWAASEGLKMVFGKEAGARYARRGRQDAFRLM